MAAKCVEKLITQIQENKTPDGEAFPLIKCGINIRHNTLKCQMEFLYFLWLYRICIFNGLGGVYTKNCDTATLLGLIKQKSHFSPVTDLKAHADFVWVKLMAFNTI